MSLRVSWQKARRKIMIFALEAKLRPVRPYDMWRLGTYYGGWWIPTIDPARGPAVCVGAGNDVTFDLELQRLGYRVYTVDPTPAAVTYVETHHPELSLVPVGVWDSDGEIAFVQDEVWDESWMIAETGPTPGGDRKVSMPVQTVGTLMRSLGEEHIAILKLDVEGAEHAVLQQMLASGPTPDVVCVEFDAFTWRQVVRSCRRMQAAGYDLLQIEGLNYIFARR